MVQPHSVSNREQVIDTMIELTRLSSQLRAIVAGSDSLDSILRCDDADSLACRPPRPAAFRRDSMRSV
jgi:hypothetical protein